MARAGSNNSTSIKLVASSPSQLYDFTKFTIAFWIKKEDTISNDAYLLNAMGNKKVHVDSSGRLIVSIERDTTDTLIRTESNTIVDDEWVHVAITADYSSIQFPIINLYLTKDDTWNREGTVTQGSGNLVSDSGDLIVLGSTGSLYGFPGSIGELGIWNRVLTDHELQNLALGRYTPALISENLQGAWRLLGTNPEPDTINNNNLVSEPDSDSVTISDHIPGIVTETSSVSTVQLYAPHLTSPIGEEVFNKGTILITWEIKEPPTNQSNITLDDITYELEYTEDYQGRETDWYVIKRRISGRTVQYSWNVGRLLKSDQVRIRIRSFCDLINKTSEYSASSNDFSVNVFKLNPPAILSPIEGNSYIDYITIILDETEVLNTYNQKVRYTFEYQSEEASVSWTTLFQNLPVGSSPLRWNIDTLPTSTDYQLKITVSDPNNDQHAVVYVRNITIVQPGLFLIDTKPPEGVLTLENNSIVTNERNHIVNLFLEDETTDIKTLSFRDWNLTTSESGTSNVALTLGEVDESFSFNPLQIQTGCEEFKDRDDNDVPAIGYSPKITWNFRDESGLIKLETKLMDYGGNDSCQKNNHLFMPVWKSTEVLTDLIVFRETRDIISITEQGEVTTISKPVNIAYVSTLSGKIYSLTPFSRLLYDLQIQITKMYRMGTTVYVFAYNSLTDNSFVYRDDRTTELTLVNTFTDALSKITAVSKYNNSIYFGMQSGELWKFDESTFTLLKTFTVPVSSLSGDNKYLYIGLFSGGKMWVYDGTFTELDIEV